MLINCKECGERVSESAPLCPKCGIPNPAGRNCVLSVTRKRALTLAISQVEIFVDNNLVGRLKNGDTIDIKIAPGEYEAVAVITNLFGISISRSILFDVHGGQTFRSECGFSVIGNFYFKYAPASQAETSYEGLSILEEAELAVMPEKKQAKMMKQRNSNYNQESEFSEEPLEFCFYCGVDLNGNQTACPSCGRKLK